MCFLLNYEKVCSFTIARNVMMRWAFVLIILVFICPLELAAQAHHTAQPDTLVITAEALEKGITLDTLRVRFHAGDDMRWKEPNVDDSAWQVVRNDTAGRLLPEGIGWYRAYIRFAPQIIPTSASIWTEAMKSFTAEEIYLNGRLLYQAGSPSAYPEQEIPYSSVFPIPRKVTVFATSDVQVLAVRTSTWNQSRSWLLHLPRTKELCDPGAGLRLANIEHDLAAAQTYKEYVIIGSIAAGVLVQILFFLFFLYLNDRTDTTLLYYALCVASLLLNNLTIDVLPDYVVRSGELRIILNIASAIGNIGEPMFLMFSAVSLFKKHPSQLRIALSLIAFVVYLLVLYGVSELQFASYLGAFILSLIWMEIVRIIYVGLRTTKLSVNLAVICGGIALNLVANIPFLISPLMFGESFLFTLPSLSSLAYCIIPMIITISLTLRTARDRARLARYSHDLEEQVQERTLELQAANEEISRQMEIQSQQTREIEQAHEESETLLLNILPAPIAHRLKSGERAIADKFDSVTVLFADIVGFTKLSARTSPEELVQGLNGIFERFDALAHKYDLEKIKTIGDAYMVAGGLPERSTDHCERVALFALEIQAAMQNEELRTREGKGVQLRIGIHTGAAVAGVIGTSKFSYDLWGDTVNTASRMESHGEAGRVHVSEEVFTALQGKFAFEERGEMEIKGKGMMRTWFLIHKQ